jgi:hypothetical protein
MNISLIHPKVRFWWRWRGPKWEEKDEAFKGKCHNPSIGFVTKAKAWKGVGQKCNPGITFGLLGMWRHEPTHSQMDSQFGSWKPHGVSKFQKCILGVKIHWIKKFLVPLKNSWNVDVSNGLAWPIWVLKTQVMAKRKVKNQNVNLTSTHYK